MFFFTSLCMTVYILSLNIWLRCQLSFVQIYTNFECCLPDWANLALLVRMRLIKSLFCHGLLNLSKSSKSKSQLVHKQRWSLYPSTNTCQVSRVRKASDYKHKTFLIHFRQQVVIFFFLLNYFALPYINLYCQHCQFYKWN